MPDPQFDWKHLADIERQAAWRDLAGWVEWLQANYAAWVKLPACWPEHEPLRAELMFMKAMHDEALASKGGYDGVNWHQLLRASAREWEQFADCKHESPPWKLERGSEYERRLQRHLQRAMQASASPPKPGPNSPQAARQPQPY